MNGKKNSFDEWEEEEALRRSASYPSIQARAELERKAQEEFDLGVRQGWWDKEGNVLEDPEECNEDTEEEN